MILATEQEMIRDSMRIFDREGLAPFAGDWNRPRTFPAEALKGQIHSGCGYASDFRMVRSSLDVRVWQIDDSASDIAAE